MHCNSQLLLHMYRCQFNVWISSTTFTVKDLFFMKPVNPLYMTSHVFCIHCIKYKFIYCWDQSLMAYLFILILRITGTKLRQGGEIVTVHEAPLGQKPFAHKIRSLRSFFKSQWPLLLKVDFAYLSCIKNWHKPNLLLHIIRLVEISVCRVKLEG